MKAFIVEKIKMIMKIMILTEVKAAKLMNVIYKKSNKLLSSHTYFLY